MSKTVTKNKVVTVSYTLRSDAGEVIDQSAETDLAVKTTTDLILNETRENNS